MDDLNNAKRECISGLFAERAALHDSCTNGRLLENLHHYGIFTGLCTALRSMGQEVNVVEVERGDFVDVVDFSLENVSF